MYRVTMTTDGAVGARADISYNGVLDTIANVPSGSYTIVATVPSAYTFNGWNTTAGTGKFTNASLASTDLRVTGSVTVMATYELNYQVSMITDNIVGARADILYNDVLDTSANVPSGSYTIIATTPANYVFTGWQITEGTGRFTNASLASTDLRVSAPVTVKATYTLLLYKVTMITDGTQGLRADILYNDVLDTSANVPSGSYTIVATVPSAYTFDGWSITLGSGLIVNVTALSTTLVVTESVTVKACTVDPSQCPTLPVFTPAVCGVAQSRIFPDPTSRAARKALKGPSIFSGQAQSTRIGALKRCITQVNTSEIGFNRVDRVNETVCDTITYQEVVQRFKDTQLVPMVFNANYLNERQPTLNIITADLDGNIYTLMNFVTNRENRLSITRYTVSELSITKIDDVPLILPAYLISAELVSANFFWRNDILVFIGIFYDTYTYITIYSFDTDLFPTLQYEKKLGAKRYTGQSTFNSAGYIYITLAAPPSGGFETSPLYYFLPDFSLKINTNVQSNYSSIQQTVGDTNNGALLTAIISNQVYLVYLYGSAVYWQQFLFNGSTTVCAIAIKDTSILILGYNGVNVIARNITYTPQSITYNISETIVVPMRWPNGIPYTVQSVTLCASPTAQRFFYTMYLYNPAITNFQYYVQFGEINFNGLIVGTQTNIQINSGYNIAPTNTIQANANYLTIVNGMLMTTFAITYPKAYNDIIIQTRERKYCITRIINPGVCTLIAPVNNTPPLDGLTRTLKLAICQPIKFSNPGSSDGCGPVYTEPTKYLTEESGAEPPQGPGVKTIVRKYDRINGIDEICKPIPGRYGSTRTARIRSNIEAAGATRYATTVLPQVQYPFPCPVYGNQTGIPRASLCQPSIDGRPVSSL